MPVRNIYCAYGDDVALIENKWLPDLRNKYKEADWTRLDASIDFIDANFIISELMSESLFTPGKVVFIRNADEALDSTLKVVQELLKVASNENVLVLILSALDKRTTLGKILADQVITREFQKPEIKPFDFIENLSRKKTALSLHQSKLLFENGSNIFILYALMCGHFSLLRRIKDLRNNNFNTVAKDLGIHAFRAKKLMEVEGFWTKEDLNTVLRELDFLGRSIKTWQHDPIMLLHMFIVSICLGKR